MFQIYSKTTNFVEKLQQQNCIYTELTTQLSQVELRSKERGARSKRIPCSYIQKWQTSEQNIPLAPRSLPLAPQKLSLRNLN